MLNVGKKIALGAAWMIGLRLLQRSLGLLSTIVLARLLLPADFGLVAMALSFYALIELFAMVGFDLAIIRQQHADREHFDTAWTLGIGLKVLVALVLVIGAPFVASFYDDVRLERVVQVLALVSFVGALENIGIVTFRKEMEFDKEFRFQLAKKLLSVVATVILAVYFRSYWALILGMLVSAALGVVLSYVFHPYRPSFTVRAWREMTGFSLAVAFNNIASFLLERGPDFIVGRFLNAQALGTYRVASEVAALPTTELYYPIMRAVFPGYSKVVDQPLLLKQTYLSAQAALSTIVMPVAIGLAVVAEPFVLVLLGEKWSSAIPVLQILAFAGAVRVLHGNRHALFMAKGRPQWVGYLTIAEAAMLLPLVGYWLWVGESVEMVAWARVLTSVIALPMSVFLVTRVISMSMLEFLSSSWRPLVACGLMAWIVTRAADEIVVSGVEIPPLGAFLILSFTGAIAYGIGILASWLLAGRPAGIERNALTTIRNRGWLPDFLTRRLLD